MKNLKNKLTKERLTAIAKITGASYSILEKHLALESPTPFLKSQEQHYSLKESIYLHDDFENLLHVKLLDYGSKFEEDRLERNIGSSDREPLELKISEIDYKHQKVVLEGGIYGDLLHASANDPIAKFLIAGFKPGDYKKLDLYKTLTCEAYLLESRGDTKLSFFTYFTAIESFAALKIQDYKSSVHPELHHALEHLSLDDKIKIAGRESCSTDDLSTIPAWGDVIGEFKKAQKLRNKIAHAHSRVEVSTEQVDSVFYCLAGLIAIMNSKKYDFISIRKHLFP